MPLDNLKNLFDLIQHQLISEKPDEIQAAIEELKHLIDVPKEAQQARKKELFAQVELKACCEALHALSSRIAGIFPPDAPIIAFFHQMEKAYTALALKQLIKVGSSKAYDLLIQLSEVLNFETIKGRLLSGKSEDVLPALMELKHLAEIPENEKSAQQTDFFEKRLKDCCDVLFILSRQIAALFLPEVPKAVELFQQVRQRYINLAVEQKAHKALTKPIGTATIKDDTVGSHLKELAELLERDGLSENSEEVLIEAPENTLFSLSAEGGIIAQGRIANMQGSDIDTLARVTWLAVDLTARKWKSILDEAIQEKKERLTQEQETRKTEKRGKAETDMEAWPFKMSDRQQWVKGTKQLRHRRSGVGEYPAISAGFQAAAAGMISLYLPSRTEVSIERWEIVARNLGNITNLFAKSLAEGAVTAYRSLQKPWIVDLMHARYLVHFIRYGAGSPEEKRECLSQLQQEFYQNRRNEWCYNYLMLRELMKIIETHELEAIRRQAFWGSPVEVGLAHFLFSTLDYQDKGPRVWDMAQERYERLLRSFSETSTAPAWLFAIPSPAQGMAKWLDDFAVHDNPHALMMKQREHDAAERRTNQTAVEETIQTAVKCLTEGKLSEMRCSCLLLHLRKEMFGNEAQFQEDCLTLINERLYPALLEATRRQITITESTTIAEGEKELIRLLLHTRLTLSGPFADLNEFFRFLRHDFKNWNTVLDDLGEWLTQHREDQTCPEKAIQYQKQIKSLGVFLDELQGIKTFAAAASIQEDEAKSFTKANIPDVYAHLKRHLFTEPLVSAFHEGFLSKHPEKERTQLLSCFDAWQAKLLPLAAATEEEADAKIDSEGTESFRVILYRVGADTSVLLKGSIAQELWSAETHQIKKQHEPSRSPVAYSPSFEIYAKGDPNYPAEEFKARSLWYHMMGERQPMELVMMQEERAGKPVGEPRLVLLTKGVPCDRERTIKLEEIEKDGKTQQKIKLSDGTLRDYELAAPQLREDRTTQTILPDLDRKQFSLLFLFTLLIGPGDGKSSNYVYEKAREKGGKRRIVSIDNEEIFNPAVRKKLKTDKFATYQSYVIQIKSLLYCLPEVNDKIDPEAIQKFLALDPEQVLREWLLDCAGFDQQYGNLLRRIQSDTLGFQMRFKEGAVAARYEMINQLQDILRKAQSEQRELSHLELMDEFEPLLGAIYSKAWRNPKNLTPKDRFDEVAKGQYKKIIRFEKELHLPPAGEVPSSAAIHTVMKAHERSVSVATRAKLLDLSSRGLIESEDEKPVAILRPLEESKDQTTDAMSELKKIVEERHLVKETIQIMRWGDADQIQKRWDYLLTENHLTGRTRFDQLHSDWLREQLIASIRFKDVPEQQEPLLKGLKKALTGRTLSVTMRQLILADCDILTDKDLDALTNSCPELRWLDISGCTKITEDGIKKALTHCPHLRHLNISRLPNLINLKIQSEKEFGSALETLVCQDNEKLQAVNLGVPSLQSASFARSQALTKLQVQSLNLEHLNLESCKELKRQTLYEKYPFLAALSLENLPEHLIKQLESVLDEAFEEKGITYQKLPSKQRLTLARSTALWFNFLTEVLKKPNPAGEALKVKVDRTKQDETPKEDEAPKKDEKEKKEKRIVSKEEIKKYVAWLKGWVPGARIESAEAIRVIFENIDKIANREVVESRLGEIIEGLLAGLKDDSWYVKYESAIAIGVIFEDIDKIANREVVESRLGEIIEGLLVGLKDWNSYVRSESAKAIGMIVGNIDKIANRAVVERWLGKIIERLLAGLKDSDSEVRSELATAIVAIFGNIDKITNREAVKSWLGEIMEGLLTGLKRWDSAVIRSESAKAIGVIFENIDKIANRNRKVVESRLGEIIERLLSRLNDIDPNVRSESAKAIGMIIGKTEKQSIVEKVLKELLSRLKDKEDRWESREGSAIAIGRILEHVNKLININKELLKKMCDSLLGGLKDKNSEVSQACKEALFRLGNLDVMAYWVGDVLKDVLKTQVTAEASATQTMKSEKQGDDLERGYHTSTAKETRAIEEVREMDTHWYDNREMDRLLGYYLSGQEDRVEILTAIGAHCRSGATLEENLAELELQRVINQSSGISAEADVSRRNTLVIPLNLGNWHWVALYVNFPTEDRTKPIVKYIDPFGSAIRDESLIEALTRVYPQLTFQYSSVRFQYDYYNCGPWVVAILESLVKSQGQAFPSKEFDIEKRRQEDQAVLQGLSAYERGEFASDSKSHSPEPPPSASASISAPPAPEPVILVRDAVSSTAELLAAVGSFRRSPVLGISPELTDESRSAFGNGQ